MQNKGNATLIVITVVALGFLFIKYLSDQGSRLVTIANAQKAAEAAARAGAATYGKSLAEDLRSCIKTKIELIPKCSYSADVKNCFNQNLENCNENIKGCIEETRNECKSEFENMKESSKAKARDAAQSGANNYHSEITTFQVDNDGKVLVEIRLKGQNLDGSPYYIDRNAEAINLNTEK